MTAPERRSGRSDLARRLGPLPGLGIAVLLVLAVLPSALNVPQSNPTTTPEFAPVPPQDNNNQPPVAGNIAGLGSASSPGLGQGPQALPTTDPAVLPPPPPPGEPGGTFGKQPSSKDCVGNPPRQTEDPLSPPCVGYFQGDNGGATYTGVTRNEITTLFVYDGCDNTANPTACYYPTSQGSEASPPPGYYDLAKPATGPEMIILRELRLWQAYFNNRYQTYGRRVHFWVQFTDYHTLETPEARRAGAADNFKRLHPFTSFARLAFGSDQAYTDAMAQNGVLNFGGRALSTAAFYAKYPKRIWSYLPSIEQQARTFSSMICTKIRPYKVSFSGNPLDDRKPRKYGVIYVNDSSAPELAAYEAAVERDLKRCGVAFDGHRLVQAFDSTQDEVQKAAVAMASFKADGVTTVISVDASLQYPMQSAAGGDYVPEWLLAPNQSIDGNFGAQQNNQQEMAHAWVTTPSPLDSRFGVEAACNDAVRSLDPSVSPIDMAWYCANYDNLRQYFTAIQVAGPRLSPDSIDQGFRAIPPHSSSSPDLPACYYDPGDYTCVKDAMAEWWDPAGGNSDVTGAGCWRAIRGGKRFRAGGWPRGDVMSDQNKQSDPCNTFEATST